MAGKVHVYKPENSQYWQFVQEYEALAEGYRSAKYVADHSSRIRNHLEPFFGKMAVKDIGAGMAQEYRIERMNSERPPARSTLHHEVVTLRQILKKMRAIQCRKIVVPGLEFRVCSGSRTKPGNH